MKTFFFLLILILASCNATKFSSLQSKDDLHEPPGTMEISSNLYLDKTEITNFNWLEYLYWVERYYGDKSPEYQNALPDENVWSKLNENYFKYGPSYLHHPAYRDYPVVGVSYNQAINFSKWRSDRVMEYSLIRADLIDYNLSTNKDSVFTIARYFSGNYYNHIPDKRVRLYPKYGLPDSVSFYKLNMFADSLNSLNIKYCRKDFCTDRLLTDCNCFENHPHKTDSLPFGPDPTMNTTCYSCKRELVTHLKGNVREMTNVPGIFYGLSFIDSCKIEYNSCRHDVNTVNAYTGFRNVCRYKEWQE